METATATIIQAIYRMLLELASGNTKFKIKYEGDREDVQSLIELLNYIADSNNHAATIRVATGALPVFPDPPADVPISQKNLNSALQLLLYIPHKAIAFKSPVVSQSTFLQALQQTIQRRKTFSHVVQLEYETGRGAQLKVTCSAIVPAGSTKLQIVMLALRTGGAEHKSSLRPRNFDPLLFEQIHAYIIEHIDKQLPRLKVLARVFGTNDFTLKAGFRHFYNTSIYQFYNDSRLAKAYDMVFTTSEPLLNIALSCGYTNYTTFARAFIRKYMFSPAAARKPSP